MKQRAGAADAIVPFLPMLPKIPLEYSRFPPTSLADSGTKGIVEKAFFFEIHAGFPRSHAHYQRETTSYTKQSHERMHICNEQ
jgi:hypothetical protein